MKLKINLSKLFWVLLFQSDTREQVQTVKSKSTQNQVHGLMSQCPWHEGTNDTCWALCNFFLFMSRAEPIQRQNNGYRESSRHITSLLGIHL